MRVHHEKREPPFKTEQYFQKDFTAVKKISSPEKKGKSRRRNTCHREYACAYLYISYPGLDKIKKYFRNP
jgi:hypothetical protein